MVPVLHVLMREFVIHGLLVTIWALCSAFAFPLGKERAELWSVALVVGVCPGELLQHLLSGGHGATGVDDRLVAFHL